jgi:hypothetical protein
MPTTQPILGQKQIGSLQRSRPNTSTVPENPPFRHCYANLPTNPNLTPPTNPMPPPQCPLIPVRRCVVNPPRGNIEELPEQPPEQPKDPSDPGDDDGRDDGRDEDDDPKPDPNTDPIPNPNPNGEADGEAHVGWLLAALKRLADNATCGNRPATSKAKIRDPNKFDGSDTKML